MYRMYLHVYVCIMHVSCMYNLSEYAFYKVDTSGYAQNMHSMKWIQADTAMICKFMYLYVSDTSGYALHVSVCIQECISVCTLCLSVCIVCIHALSPGICMYY